MVNEISEGGVLPCSELTKKEPINQLMTTDRQTDRQTDRLTDRQIQ